MDIKKIIKITVLFVLFSAFLNLNTYAADFDNMYYITHAGGQVENEIGTNSLEALNNSFCYGYRYIEMDFNFTSDENLVCIHDWDEDYFRTGKTAGTVLSLSDFKNSKMLGKFTPLTAEDLSLWLYKKPETYIITDIKENNVEGLKYIAENYSYIKDRIIPQIYNEEEYDDVKALGYDNIIYTLYKLNYNQKTDTKQIVKFAKNHPLYAIVFSSELATENYINELKQSGTKLMTHTVNTVEDAQKMLDMGIDGIYSDYLKENLK